MLSCSSHVRLFATLWTVAHQALSVHGFPSKNTRVGCHALLQGIFATQGLNPRLSCLLHWQLCFLSLVLPGKPSFLCSTPQKKNLQEKSVRVISSSEFTCIPHSLLTWNCKCLWSWISMQQLNWKIPMVGMVHPTQRCIHPHLQSLWMLPWQKGLRRCARYRS